MTALALPDAVVPAAVAILGTLAFAIFRIAFSAVRSMAVDDLRGRIVRDAERHFERTLELLPPLLHAEFAEEWRAEYESMKHMPLTTLYWVCTLRASLPELEAQPATVVGTGSGSAGRRPPLGPSSSVRRRVRKAQRRYGRTTVRLRISGVLYVLYPKLQAQYRRARKRRYPELVFCLGLTIAVYVFAVIQIVAG